MASSAASIMRVGSSCCKHMVDKAAGRVAMEVVDMPGALPSERSPNAKVFVTPNPMLSKH